MQVKWAFSRRMIGNGENKMAKKAISVYLKTAIESGFSFIKRQFKSVSELNENFQKQRKWIHERLQRKVDYKQRLSKVLEVLKMHSCKYLGISFLTENALCVAYKEQFGESISKRSVTSYVNCLRENGLITTIAAKREDGKQTANIVVMKKLEVAGKEKTKVSSAEAEESGKEPSKNVAHKAKKNLRTNKTTSPPKTTVKENKERIAKDRRLLNFIPRWFKEQIACYTSEAKTTYELWKVAKHLVERKLGSMIDVEERKDVVRRAIREFYLSAKAAARGKFDMRNPFGFFHTVLEAEGYAHVRRQVQASSSLFYNWLEE